MRRPHLCGHEHVVALDPGCAQPLANFALVLVDLGRIDMAIAELQSLLDDASAGASTQLPGAKPDRRDLCAACLDKIHEYPP